MKHQALMFALSRTLKDDIFTKSVRESWIELYEGMSRDMIQGGKGKRIIA